MKVKLSYTCLCGKNTGALNVCNTNNLDKNNNDDFEDYNALAGIVNVARYILYYIYALSN